MAVVVEKRFEYYFYGKMFFFSYGVATPLLWENVFRLMVWLLHFYGKMWFGLWCGYSNFMGKCDSAYGVATPLFPHPISVSLDQLTTYECNSVIQNVSKVLYCIHVTSHSCECVWICWLQKNGVSFFKPSCNDLCLYIQCTWSVVHQHNILPLCSVSLSLLQ